MYRPAFNPTKLRINYDKTWAQLMRLLREPKRVVPPPRPAHLDQYLAGQKTIKLPQLRGNLVQTLKEIVSIFIADYRRGITKGALAIKTTRAALSKRGWNRDPKTAYRHVQALIEYGFLRGKQQIKGGLQLLLNPLLIVFDASAAEAQLMLAGPVVPQPTVTPAEGLASLLAAAPSPAKMLKTPPRPS